MSKRSKPLHGNGAGALTPALPEPVKIVPNLHAEETLWVLYRQARVAADNFRRQRDQALAALRQYKAVGKIRHIAKSFKPREAR